jgi:uncharacterized protein with beta-barrel porin domain
MKKIFKRQRALAKKVAAYSSAIAIGTVASMGGANAANFNMTEAGSSGSSNMQGSGTLAAGDTVNLATFTLTVNHDLVLASNDLHAVIGTTGTLALSSTQTNATVIQTFASFATSGAGNLSVTTQAGSSKIFNAIFSGVVTTVGGAITIVGDTNTALATHLSIGGASIGGTGTTITLDETATKGTALLTLASGSATQTVTGTINGAAAGEGALDISNGSNASIISNEVGNLFGLRLIDIDSAATFSSTVNAVAIDQDFATTYGGALTGTGAVTIDGHTIFNDDVTLSSATEAVIAGAGTASTLTFKGETFTATGANGLESEADGTKFVADAASGDQSINTKFTHDAVGELVVENSNVSGTVTFEKGIGAVGGNEAKLIDTDVNTKSLFKAVIASDLVTIDGVATFQVGVNEATNIDLNTVGKMIIDDTIVDGVEIFTVGTAVADGSIAGTDNIKLPANLLHGETLVLVAGTTDANDAAVVIDAQLAVMDTAIRTYTVSAVNKGTNDEDITITVADNSDVATATNLKTNVNVGRAMLAAGIAVETDATALDAMTFALNEEGGFDGNEDTKLALQLAPQTETSSGSSTSVKAMTGSVQGIVSNRMASLRSGDAYVAGMSAGNGMSAQSAFIQAFGSEAEQKNTMKSGARVFGYDSETSGVAIGIDGITDFGSTVGLSASYSSTTVDGKGTGKSSTDIDSYTVSVYADKATDNGYVEGSLTYGINENSTTRTLAAAGLNRKYTGQYDSEQLSLKVGAGSPREVADSTFVTPYGSFTSTLITTDQYTETSNTGSDNLKLKINQDDISSLVGSVGVKAHMVTAAGTPMISLQVNNEFGDTSISSSNIYTGGGTAFKTTTDVEALSATLGLGYSFGNDITSINLSYEAEASDDDYLGHYGSVKIIAKF